MFLKLSVTESIEISLFYMGITGCVGSNGNGVSICNLGILQDMDGCYYVITVICDADEGASIMYTLVQDMCVVGY